MSSLTTPDPVISAPTGARERVAALDVLRGMALYGVFVANFVGLVGWNVMQTEEQRLSLPTAGIDHALFGVLQWLVFDKANTIFAFLFGLGFHLQRERLQARGADANKIYLRRLSVLLLFGIVHMLFVWVWDILHLYALAGFALFALRKMSDRALLVWGITLAIVARISQEWLVAFTPFSEWHGYPSVYTDAAVTLRQAQSTSGDYLGLLSSFAQYNWVDYLLNGLFAAWFCYALGRFMLGAWVGRRGWLERSGQYLPGFERVFKAALPTGLLLEGLATIAFEIPNLQMWGVTLHLVSAPVLATGYVCAVVVALHTSLGARVLAPFASVGRMALSNYVAQSLFYGFWLFGVGPGLDLAGHVGTSAALALASTSFVAQMVVSHWWLARFRYGPLEWAWRYATYGHAP